MNDRKSILITMADKAGMEAKNYEATLRATVFPQAGSQAQLALCLKVANDLDLDPLSRQIYFMPTRGGGIQPIVGYDGWVAIMQKHPQANGIKAIPIMKGTELIGYDCYISRKDWSEPIVITELLNECLRDTPTWRDMPNRMMRNRVICQGIRLAFGVSGVMDPDEYEQWQERPNKRLPDAKDITPVPPPPPEVPALTREDIKRAGDAADRASSKFKDDLRKSLEEENAKHAKMQQIHQEEDYIPLYASDPDAYLANLEQSCADADTSEVLAEVYDCHVSIEENMFPPDRAKADKIFERHEERIAHAKGGDAPRPGK